MTEHTPKTMPKTVRSDLNRCSQRLLIPRRKVRPSCENRNPPRWLAWRAPGQRGMPAEGIWGLSSDIALDLAIAQAEDAPGVPGNTVIVGHQDQGFALLVQVIEKPQDLYA